METDPPAQNPSDEPLQLDAAIKRMKTLQEQGRYQQALDACVQLMRGHPGVARVVDEVLLQVNAIFKRAKAFQEQGRYQQALDICLQITRAYPGVAIAWSDASVNCIHLARWQDAVGYAQTALRCGGSTLALHSALSHAYGHLEQRDEVRRHGLQALDMNARQLSGEEPVIPWPEPGPLPPPPSARTRERNVIAFSLFGGDAKYCETAVLNVQEQPRVYPHWVCRFYIDGSVPDHVIDRLRAGGGQVIPVGGAQAQWPGPMWRLLALGDPQAHRILFRDTDSVISRREAAAVEQWIASGQRFHMMRDWCTHTELMLAGLWGVVGGALPPLDQLMERFMSAPLQSRRFADQDFLRQYVWPYARASLMQHDSVFGFMDAAPFPDEEMPSGFHVGCMESLLYTQATDLPDGSQAVWELYRIERLDDGQTRQERVCAYTNTVQNGALSIHVPARYAQWIQQGTARLRLMGAAARQGSPE